MYRFHAGHISLFFNSSCTNIRIINCTSKLYKMVSDKRKMSIVAKIIVLQIITLGIHKCRSSCVCAISEGITILSL